MLFTSVSVATADAPLPAPLLIPITVARVQLKAVEGVALVAVYVADTPVHRDNVVALLNVGTAVTVIVTFDEFTKPQEPLCTTAL